MYSVQYYVGGQETSTSLIDEIRHERESLASAAVCEWVYIPTFHTAVVPDLSIVYDRPCSLALVFAEVRLVVFRYTNRSLLFGHNHYFIA